MAMALGVPVAAGTSGARGEHALAGPFPMDVLADHGPRGGLELALRAQELARFDGSSRLWLTGVPLPDGSSLDLDLERVRVERSSLERRLDGERIESASVPDTSMWKGTVLGDAGSDAFLAFSRHGTRGWIRRAAGLVHILAGPGTGGDWSRSGSLMIGESALSARGSRATPPCWTDTSNAVHGLGPSMSPAGVGFSALTSPGTLECRMAIETDWQLNQRFNGDVVAEQAYLLQLFGAVSARYQEQVDVVLSLAYLGLYSTPNDPWHTPDNLGTANQMLLEFQSAWSGAIPGGAQLAHFLSGEDLGGGKAFLDSLCTPQNAFAVSSGIDNYSGTTPFPVMQGPLNWDFIVLAHETGHGFGSIHTHEFCLPPSMTPIDECAPPLFFGPCQSAQVCINNGTLMSFCHLCAGSYANIGPYFHPECANVMRARAESCLPPLHPGNAFCAGDGIDPTVTTACPCNNFGASGHGCANSVSSAGAQLVATGSVAQDSVVLTNSLTPMTVTNIFLKGTADVAGGVVFGDGILCAGGVLRRFGQQTSAGGVSSFPMSGDPSLSTVSATTPGSGVTIDYQVYYRNALLSFCPPATFNVSNGWKITW